MATKRKSKGGSTISKIHKKASQLQKAAKGSARKYKSFFKEAAKALKK